MYQQIADEANAQESAYKEEVERKSLELVETEKEKVGLVAQIDELRTQMADKDQTISELGQKLSEISALLLAKENETEEIRDKFESSTSLLDSADRVMTELRQDLAKQGVYTFLFSFFSKT